MRVLLIADTHGAFDAAIAAQARTCDIVVHAGDIGAAVVLEQLREACARVVAIRGNNDVAAKWATADRTLVQALPEQAEVELPGGRLVAVHGDRFAAAQRHRRLRAAFPDARAIVYGHSHRLCIDDAESPWVLNPGAAGRTRTFGGASGLLLTATTSDWRIEVLRSAA